MPCAGAEAIGEPYRDADEREYLPLLVQPVLVYEAPGRAPHRDADAVLKGLKRHP